MLSRFLHTRQARQHWNTREMVAAELVRVAERIPADELSDPDARAALISAIRAGEVIGVYTPRSYALHNIELGGCPRDIDPRISAEQFTAYWRTGKNTGATIAEQHTAAQRAAQAAARAARQEGQD